jgi:hypothetical protein
MSQGVYASWQEYVQAVLRKFMLLLVAGECPTTNFLLSLNYYFKDLESGLYGNFC